MKNIEPIQIWINGQLKQASVLDARIINDDLKTTCNFYYELRESSDVTSELNSGIRLAEGNLTLSGEDYINWDGSNDFAFEFIANHLNLTLIIEPIDPVVSSE
jgi:hypothetical protein